ncbi:LuxR C-terminal-related transcriptional regulator [Umezawaea endophytica]|uniref:LuxR C-terminal-related transcriptional regulator n=1 Tax=Umezawaea endophytica TaxID=1654476 RepID=A0A9X2VWX1_9PSEU|nr:LuxR C-terminal-related transcriptional regulator [Umezawaea endophytica]MCS7483579.1 LuxR C-terminal-related transcriptional regulator [Umezawaea endophytica]
MERSHQLADDKLYRSMFERSGLGMARLDPKRKVLEANADLLNFFGRSIHDVYSRDFTELVHPGVRPGLERQMEKLAEGKRGRFAEQVAAVRSDGSTVPITMTAIAVHGDGPSITALLVILKQAAGDRDRTIVDQGKVLTDVHARILEGMAAGESTTQLASRLFLSRQGVEYHLGTMLRKLKAPNRTALVSRAYAMGMLSVASWPPRVEPAFVK